MKKTLLFLVVILFSSVTVNAQLTEGHVKYEMTVTSDNPAMEMAIAMMDGATMEIYFKGESTLVKVNMGMAMNMTTTTNSKSGEVLIKMGGMMGNKAIRSTLDEMKDQQPEESMESDVSLMNETKDIQGFKCKKAIFKDKDGNEAIFWYTEEITVSKLGQNYLNKDIPGFPLEFEMNQKDMKMAMKAILLEKSINNASELFSMKIPAGYQEISMKDMNGLGM